MRLYTIEDLERRLYHYPHNLEQTGWVTYGKRWLTEQIHRDYVGKNSWEKKKEWNQEEPAVWGVLESKPYPKAILEFVKQIKAQAGGRKMIVMNESYFDNCYFDIEDKYFRQEKTVFKTDTRKEIADRIKESVCQKNTQQLSVQIRKILNVHLTRLNKKIENLNESRKKEYENFTQCNKMLHHPYVKCRLIIPEELLAEQNRQKEILLKTIKLLQYPKLDKLIEKDKKIILQKDYISSNPNYPSFNDDTRLQMLVDRIQQREKDLIKKYKKFFKQYQNEMSSFYLFKTQFKEEIKKQVESKQELAGNQFLVDWLKNAKLI